jgi:hypothetical protein
MFKWKENQKTGSIIENKTKQNKRTSLLLSSLFQIESPNQERDKRQSQGCYERMADHTAFND